MEEKNFDTDLENVNSADSLPEQENGDSWQFEAEAPTIADDFLSLEPQAEVVENPQPKAENNDEEEEEVIYEPQKNNQIVISKDALKFIPLAIFVALCVALIATLSIRYFTIPNGKEGKYMNPGSVVATIGDEKISMGQFNYYYSTIVNYYETYGSYYGLDTTQDYATQFTTDDEGNSVSWEEYFKNEVFEEIKYSTALYSAGIKAGVTVTDAQQQTIEEQIETFKASASEQGITLNDYISSQFGEYCTEETIRLMLEEYYITVNYKGMLSTSTQPTEEEIQKYYSDNLGEFEQINFSFIALEYDASSDETKAEAQKKIDKYYDKITDRKSLLKLVPVVYKDYIESDIESILQSDDTITKAEAEKTAVENYESSIDYTISDGNTPFDDTTTDWLFSDDTKIGDKTIYINDAAGFAYIILKTENPSVDETLTYTVRHILIMPKDDEGNTDPTGATEFTDEQWAAAEKTANEILDTYNKGDKTEYSFALLAEQHSDDTASTSASGNSEMFGGLCEAISVEEDYVEEFKNWSIDDSRKYGDVDIVKSMYGYHIMFFINNCESYKASVISAQRAEEIDKQIEDATLKLNEAKITKAINAFNELKAATADTSAVDDYADDFTIE